MHNRRSQKAGLYLKFSGPCRLQNVASLAKASWSCKDEYRVAAWLSIFSAVSRVGHGALRQYSTTYCSSWAAQVSLLLLVRGYLLDDNLNFLWLTQGAYYRQHLGTVNCLDYIFYKNDMAARTVIFVRLVLASSTSSDHTSCPYPPTDAEASCSSTKSSFTL